ncbi:hypothetical protein ACFLRA_02230 [Bdellovibrionota bacterium]
MENATHIARIFGPALVIVCLFILFNEKKIKEIAKSIRETPGFLLIAGIINLLLGLTLISFYNVWAWNWGLLVTIFGWFALFRGLLIFAYPNIIKKMKFKAAGRIGWGIVFLVYGGLLSWFGFFYY